MKNNIGWLKKNYGSHCRAMYTMPVTYYILIKFIYYNITICVYVRMYDFF